MKLRVIISVIMCSLTMLGAHAQQDPLYSQYMFNMMGINPAYAGSREVLSVTGMAKAQWAGIEGAPLTEMLTADFAIKEKKIGLGVALLNDRIGVFNTTAINFNGAYRIRLSKGTLAMGLLGGVQNYKADYTSVQLASANGNNDPAFSNNVNQFKPTLGAGLYYNTDKFYVGFSTPQMLKYESYYQNAQWFLAGGYVFNLSPDVVLKPSVLLRMTKGTPINADFNANVWLHNIVALGVSVRTSSMYVAMLEVQINHQLRFGYAYDWSPTSINKGSHEFMLRYEFGYDKKRMMSPRYF